MVFALAVSPEDGSYHKIWLFLPLTLGAVFIQELFKKSEAPFTNIGYTYLGLLFTIIPFTFFHAMAYVDGPFNYHFPLAFLLMLWANDTGAYLTGRWLGRTKLFERHSPKKTWEGTIGGILLSVITITICGYFLLKADIMQLIIISAIGGIAGIFGDLFESSLKRKAGVKDSGNIMPGHGGFLDRFDSLLLATIFVWLYVKLFL